MGRGETSSEGALLGVSSTSNAANSCCSVMHILVPLEATFLSINNNRQSPLQLAAGAEMTGALEGGPWLVLLDAAEAPSEGTGP